MSFKYRDSPLYYRTVRRVRPGDAGLGQSERRFDFCLMQNMREKRKEVDDV